MKGKPAILLVYMLNISILNAQLTAVEKGLHAITTDAIMAQLGFLASDWTEGRAAGERGEYLAGDYIASMLRLYGVKPGGDHSGRTDYTITGAAGERSYFQNFSLIRALPSGEPSVSISIRSGDGTRTINLANNVDFSVRPLYRSVRTEAPVVFAGYGFRNEKIKFDDFRKTDIRGKFILIISGYPEFADKRLTPHEINTSLRAAEDYAREKGAAGILEFDPGLLLAGKAPEPEFLNMSPAERSRGPYTYRPQYYLPGKTMPDNLIRIRISAAAAAEILKGSGISISEYIKHAGQNRSYDLPMLSGRSVSFSSDAILSQVAVRNVIGIIEGDDTDQAIVIGAHYDHLGMKDGYIWNGADDNASGTVGALMLAKALKATGVKPGKTIIIALWSSEETGLLGSRYFVRNPVIPLENIRMNLNFDMISRYISEENKKGVDMTYTASRALFRDITEANLKKYGIDLEVNYHPSDNPPGGSDHRSFVEAGIPVMRFKPGHREEYHTPSDEIHTIDQDIMEKIIRISFVNIWDLANSEW